MLRFFTAGESHGQGLVVIVDGLPAGLEITAEEVRSELARRRLGFGRGPRMRFEQDQVTLLGGVRHGRTIGAPVAITIANMEWPKWEVEMSPAPGHTAKPLTAPRPGHADLAGMMKYGLEDARDVLERASARETAARVAAGSLAKKLLGALGTVVLSHVVSIGEASVDVRLDEGPESLLQPEEMAVVDSSPVRCRDREAGDAMVAAIKAAAKEGDSLGGTVEVVCHGVPAGLGSYAQWDRRLDASLAQALMSIPAVKAVEIGAGLDVASRRGSQAHDAIYVDAAGERLRRRTWRSGGVEGGISTGEPIVAHVFMKPLATLNRPVLETVDLSTGDSTVSFKERTDVTAVPAMGVVAETMTALVLAGEAIQRFGGDSMRDLVTRSREAHASVRTGQC